MNNIFATCSFTLYNGDDNDLSSTLFLLYVLYITLFEIDKLMFASLYMIPKINLNFET